MRPHVPYVVAVLLGATSLAQAAAVNRRQEVTRSANLADGFLNIIGRIGLGATVTETVRETITVVGGGGGGGGGGAGCGLNGTGVVTVTVTAPASTVTVFPGQANGAVEGVSGTEGVPSSVVATGGIGVSVIPVPEGARITSSVGSPPAASSDVAVTSSSPSSLEPLPTRETTSQPGEVLSSSPPDAPSSASPALPSSSEALQTSSATTSVPAVGAPVSDSSPVASSTSLASVSASDSTSLASSSLPTSLSSTDSSSAASSTPPAPVPSSDSAAAATSSTTSLAPLPGSASSLTDTLVLPIATPTVAFPGAFGGVPGLVPIESAAVPPSTPTTPPVANGAGAGAGAGAGPTIHLSGLTLSSQLNLGKLAPQSAAPSGVVLRLDRRGERDARG
ncbi:hypothetical protein VTH06DRAFT_684 [Thermothelomyces fergusii]